MQTEKWEIRGIFSQSVELYKQNITPIIGVMAIFFFFALLVVGISELLLWIMRHSQSKLLEMLIYIVYLGTFVLSWVLAVFLVVGYTRIFIKAVRMESPTMQDLISELPQLLPALVASLLVGVGVAVGSLLCIVPGMLLFVGWWFVMFLIVDHGLGPVEAMRESWRLTEGERLDLFLWMLLCIGLSVAGLLACCVGLFVMVPLCGLGTALIYQNLSERKSL